MNETEVMVVEGAEKAVKATSSKGWIIAGITTAAAIVVGVVCWGVNRAKAKKAEKLIETTCNEVEDDFVEETEC
jgi:hypothetical protein